MDATIFVLILICIGIWELVFTFKSSIKKATAENMHGLAQDSTLDDILKEIQRLGIRRKTDDEMTAEAEEEAERMDKKR